MSYGIEIAAEAERPETGAGFPRRARNLDEEPAAKLRPAQPFDAPRFPAPQFPAPQFPAHQFPANPFPTEASEAEIADPAALWAQQHPRLEDENRERERRTFRGRTVAMLKRYMRYSIETGRMPSLLGREIFRAKVTSYTVVTFEDRVIFVHDMEKCLERLDEFSRQLIARHVLQEHDQEATGKLLNCTERTVRTYIPIVLDLLSDILVEVGLLKAPDSIRQNSCQGGKNGQIPPSDCEEGKYKV